MARLAAVATLGACLVTWIGWSLAMAHRPAAPPHREIEVKPFKFAPGLYGPLRVMPALSIENGTDDREQKARRASNVKRPAPARPAPPPAERGEIVTPSLTPVPHPSADAPLSEEPELSYFDAVEMHLPSQMNPCFVLERLARPVYPTGVDEQARRTPQFTVEAAFYVGEEGSVTGAYIVKSDGPPPFDAAVLAAVNAWRFQPVKDPNCPPLGFWIRLPVVFRSPYVHRIAR